MAKQRLKLKSSPYTTIEYLSRFMFILIIPVCQQLLPCIWDHSRIWQAFSVNLLTCIVLIIWAYLEYKSKICIVNGQNIYLKRGFIIKHTRQINLKKLQLLAIKFTILPTLFGAAKLYLDTPAGTKKKADITLTLKKKQAQNLFNKIARISKPNSVYKAKLTRIILMTASWANPAGGLLLLAPVTDRLGKILGEEIKNKLYLSQNVGMSLAITGLNPTTEILVRLFIVGWFFAFFTQLQRYSNFKVISYSRHLYISNGLINQTERVIKYKNINAITLEQNALMRLFRLRSAYVYAIGYGKQSKNLLIAAAKEDELKKTLKQMLKAQIYKEKDKIQPNKEQKAGFLLLPGTALLLMLIFAACIYFFAWPKTLLFAVIIFFALSLWWFISRFISFKDLGVCIEDNAITMCVYRKFSCCHAWIPLQKIQYFEVSQNISQKRKGLCNLRVFILSEHRESFSVSNIELNPVEKLVENVKNISMFQVISIKTAKSTK